MLINGSGNTLANDGTLRIGVTAYVVKQDPEVDYDIEIKVTPAATPLTARILSIRQTYAQ